MHDEGISKVSRTYLHLRSLDRVMGTFPGAPIHSLRTALTVKVQAIQVGIVASVVPPTSFILQGTVFWPFVIIAILGGKRLATMITKRISSRPYKTKQNTENKLVCLRETNWNLCRGDLCFSYPGNIVFVECPIYRCKRMQCILQLLVLFQTSYSSQQGSAYLNNFPNLAGISPARLPQQMSCILQMLYCH